MTRRKPDFFTYTPRFYRVGTPTEFGVVTRLVRRERVRTSNGGTAVRWAVYCENRQPSRRDVLRVLYCRRLIRQAIGAAEFRRWMKQHIAPPIPLGETDERPERNN